MSLSSSKEFGPLRSFLWPIYTYELKRVIPMLLMFFCICFNYAIIRDLRDTLIITAPGSGAEAIPFIKVWLVVPVAMVLMLLYAKLSNTLSRQGLFYVTIIPFLLFYALFAFVLYPMRESLHPVETADRLQAMLPPGFKGFISIYRNWTFALFYTMGELWSGMVLSLVFWGFANDITEVEDAKRFYPLFGLGANFALLLSGPAVMHLSQYTSSSGITDWGLSLKYLVSLILLSGVLLLGTYYWINKYALKDDPLTKETPPPATKMNLFQSFKFLARSKYLGYIALLVLSYNMCINLVEVSWKNQLNTLYPTISEYGRFMGLFSTCTGVLNLFMNLFIGSNIMRRFGWTTAALITPIVLFLTGMGFFSFLLFKEHLHFWMSLMSLSSPLTLAVFFGTAQNLLSKSCKYSLFDPTKEMAYIPLDQESKVKGKAAIDVVGARLGKSGGSVIQQILIMSLGSLATIIPYVAVILLGMIGIWIFAIFALSKPFERLQKKEASA